MVAHKPESIEDVRQGYEADLYEALSQRDEYKRQRDELIANVNRLERILLREGLTLNSPVLRALEYIDNELVNLYYEYDSGLDPLFNPSLYKRAAREAGACNHCKQCNHDIREES